MYMFSLMTTCPGYHTREQTWVSSSAPHHSLMKAAQVISGPACMSGSSMSLTTSRVDSNFSSLCTVNLHAVGLQNLKKLTPAPLYTEASPGIKTPL